MKNIVIFASGSGSNAENIVHHFANSDKARVVAIFCNNAEAGVISRAQKLQLPCIIFTANDFKNTELVDESLSTFSPDLIVLAGFLLLFPSRLLSKYTDKVVNIHPALLPKYGGKGMYGSHVHKAVIANCESEHGVTVHLVNEEYDKGKILFQESFEVTDTDTLETIENKIHEIEFRIFPKAIDELLREN